MNEQVYNTIINPSLGDLAKFQEELAKKIEMEKELLAKCTQKNVIDLWGIDVEDNPKTVKQLFERIEELSKKNKEIGELMKKILSLLDIVNT